MSLPPRSLCLLTLLLAAGVAGAQTPADGLPRGAVVRLGSHHFRHGQAVVHVAFAPDGKRLVAQSVNGSFHVWETATGQELHRFAGMAGVSHYDDFPGGRLWRIQFHHGDPLQGQTSAAFTPDGGTLLLLGQDRTLRFRDLRTGQEVRRLYPVMRNPRGVCLAGDGKTLGLIGQEVSVRLVDVGTGKTISHVAEAPLEPRRDEPVLSELTSVAFSPDGRHVAVAGRSDTGKALVRLYDAATGAEQPFRAQVDGYVRSLQLAPGGQLLALRTDEQNLSLWDVAKAKEIRRLEQPGSGAAAVAFSPDAKVVALGQGDVIRLEEAVSGKELAQLKGHAGQVLTLAFSPDGKLLASGAADHSVRIWDLATGKEISPVTPGHQGNVLAAVCSPDGKLLATVGPDGRVYLWESASGKLRSTFALPGEAKPQALDMPMSQGAALAFGQGGKTLAAAWPHGKLGLWDVATGKPLHAKAEWGGTAMCVALTPDGRVLATGEHDGTIKLRDVRNGTEMFTIRAFHAPQDEEGRHNPGVYLLSFSPDGRTLFAKGLEFQPGRSRHDHVARHVVRVFETATGKERRALRVRPDSGNEGSNSSRLPGAINFGGGMEQILFYSGDHSMESDINAVRVSPGGRVLGLKLGREILLWDQVESREIRRVGTLHDLTEFTFSPDGKLLAAGQGDGSLNLWEVATGTHWVRTSAHRGAITAVVFTPDGRRLVTASRDTTVVLWDPPTLLEAHRPKAGAARGSLDEWWADLAAGDAARAERAVWLLASDPAASVPFLARNLRPAEAKDLAQIDRLVADLDSPRFNVREAAGAELERLGTLAEPALRKALAGKPPLELEQRLTKLLEKMRGPVTEAGRLRELRAVEVLERAGSAEALQLLDKLAQGNAGLPLTEEARAARERLAERLATRAGGSELRP